MLKLATPPSPASPTAVAEPLAYTLAGAAAALCCSESTVRRLTAAGELRSIRMGVTRGVRWRRVDLESYLAKLAAEQSAELSESSA